MLDADFGERLEAFDHLRRGLATKVDRLQGRPFDLVEWPADLVAPLTQNAELVGQLGRSAEDVAGVGVLRHQAQRLLLAPAADDDLRVRLAENLGRVEQSLRLIVLALERLAGAVITLPHGMHDLEGLVKHLEADSELRHRKAESVALLLVPGRADAEVCSPAAQDVEGRGGLGPQPRLAVVDSADHEAERGALGMRGHEGQRRPAFEHRLLRLPDAADLEEVVHHPERVEGVGRLCDVGQGWTDCGVAAGPAERRDLETDLHGMPQRVVAGDPPWTAVMRPVQCADGDVRLAPQRAVPDPGRAPIDARAMGREPAAAGKGVIKFGSSSREEFASPALPLVG